MNLDELEKRAKNADKDIQSCGYVLVTPSDLLGLIEIAKAVILYFHSKYDDPLFQGDETHLDDALKGIENDLHK